MSIFVMATVIPKAEHVQDVEAALRGLVAAARTEPGNRRYDLFRDASGQPVFHFFEIYDDEAALEAHRASAHYKAYRAKAGDWLAEAPNVRVLTAVDATPEK